MTLGDTLNIWFEHNKQFIDIAESVMSPKIMYISNNDGRCDMDMLFSRDVMINANAMKYLCSYTQDQIDRIKMLQQMN